MKLFVRVLLPIVAMMANIAVVNAQSMKAECYERSNLLYSLATEHGERLEQHRRVGNNGLLEAFKSKTEGTWTIVYSNDEGLSCVLATGDGLETEDESKTKSDVNV